MNDIKKFNVEVIINAPIETVWTLWTEPEHVKNWVHASDDWQTTHAENNLSVGGQFNYRMEEKESGESYDFVGEYDEIIPFKKLVYSLDDGHKVMVNFIEKNNQVKILENIEAKLKKPIEQQQEGWQAILDNFKQYVENYE